MNKFKIGNSIQEQIQEKYLNLERGVKSREDPVTWRTAGIDLRFLLGSPDPEHVPPDLKTFVTGTRLVEILTENTYLKPLKSEILWSVYGEHGEKLVLPDRNTIEPLDALLINGRHKTESLLWSLADHLSSLGQKVAVINPIGHYNDWQTRMVAPDLLVRPVKTAIFLSSTQTQDGGDLSVLNLALRALRNPNFAFMIDRVVIVIPMFGGSRGHRLGQSQQTGYEALETIGNAKLLIDTIKDIRTSIVSHDIYPIYDHTRFMRPMQTFPNISFITVDIHNSVLPARKFGEASFPFISASPAKEQVEKSIEALQTKGYEHLLKRIVACDEGSSERTDNFVRELLLKQGGTVELISIQKERQRAGEVSNAKIRSVVSCSLKDGKLIKIENIIDESKITQDCVLIYVDDMIDTGGTAGLDISLLRKAFSGIKYIMFVTTHPIFSQGVDEAMNKIGADVYIAGDTLSSKRFIGKDNIVVSGLAPSIARALKNEE